MKESCHVTLINLAADARTTAPSGSRLDRHDVSGSEIRELLQNFTELDPVENAAADPEVRVQTTGQSWLIRMSQRKLILYDVLNRETPGHVLTIDEAIAELDGSAATARGAAQLARALARATETLSTAMAAPTPARVERAKPARVLALSTLALALAAAAGYLRSTNEADGRPAGFTRLPAAEAASLSASHAGVYLTGTQPGQHGIVLTASGELRIFEWRQRDAPRLIHATGEWGRIGALRCLATDQPGGLITMPERDAWVYCGETYRRVP